jgi:hypothetical protein
MLLALQVAELGEVFLLLIEPNDSDAVEDASLESVMTTHHAAHGVTKATLHDGTRSKHT